MKTDFQKSWKDELDEVILPYELNEDLAEFIGILVGDGHVERRSRFRYGRWQKVYELSITGSINEISYYQDYVNPLIKRIFNTKFSLLTSKNRGACELKKNSRLIHSFIVENLNIPSRKNNMGLPKIILNSEEKLQKAFLRGYFDADGCLKFQNRTNVYPIVSLACVSKRVIYQVSNMLTKMSINNHISKDVKNDKRTNKKYVCYHLCINGFNGVNIYLREIGFSNKYKKNGAKGAYIEKLRELFELLDH